MALPKINDVPKYELTIPSTKEQVTFRPFYVKEQKVLLIALESQDQSQVLRSVMQTIEACIDKPINVYKLATFDIEYIFTQIRSKSVGENADVSLFCSGCQEPNDVTIKLEDIKIETPAEIPTIKLNDNFSVKMRYPNYSHMLEREKIQDLDPADAIILVVSACLDTLLTEEEQIKFDDETEEEVKGFVESLSTSQFNDIMNFVENVPNMQHDVAFDCTACGVSNTYTIKGIGDFF